MSELTSLSKSKYQVGLIGVGIMGEALISGLISSRFPKAQIVFTEKRVDRAREISSKYGAREVELAELAKTSDVILLLVKFFEIFIVKITLYITYAKILTIIIIKFTVLLAKSLIFIQIKMRKYRDVLFLNRLRFIFDFRVFFVFKSTYRKLLDKLKYFGCLLVFYLTLFTSIFVVFFLYFIDTFLNKLFLFQKAL